MKKNKIIGLSVTALAFAAAAGVIGTRVAKEAIHAEGTKTVYCKMEYGWWKADGAAVGIHYWGGASSTTWPGVRMSPVDNEDDVWKVDIPSDSTNCVFTRVNGSGDLAYWNAKTVDLTIPEGKDLFTIKNSSASWGDPGCEGVWSVHGEEPAESSESVSESVSESASEEPAPLAASIKINENLIPMEPVALEYADQVARWKVSYHVLEDDVVSFYVAEEKISLFSAPEGEEDKNNIKNKDDEAHEEYLIHNEADADFYLMKWKSGVYNFWATGYEAEISGEIFFAPGAGGAPLADFYLYSWVKEGDTPTLGTWPGTKLSDIEGVAGTNGLNFHKVYGALIKIPKAALAGGDHFILSTKGFQTNDFEYLDGSFYGVEYDAGTGDQSLGAPAALAFDVDAAIEAAEGESVCMIEADKAKTLVQDYDKLDGGQKAAFEDSTFYTINSESEIPGEKIDVTGSAIINMINSHIVNGGEGSLYKTLGMNDSNRTLIITLTLIGAIAIASATFIVISKKRKAK